MQTKNTKQGGFTLVEIAIVLVIIGLLLGGILKGQELINNAKVRSVADRQNSLKAAWFGFIDRYNFIPGDSKRARQLVPGVTEARSDNLAGDGILTLGESVLAMQQLTGAGFLRCPQCDGTSGAVGNTEQDPTTNPPNAENSLVNQYSGVMSIWNDTTFYASRSTGTASDRLQIHSGPRIPSNILSEVDRKIDDGIANTGDMVFNGFDPLFNDSVTPPTTYTGTGGEPDDEACMNTDADPPVGVVLRQTNEALWRSVNRPDGAVENNCGASVFI